MRMNQCLHNCASQRNTTPNNKDNNQQKAFPAKNNFIQMNNTFAIRSQKDLILLHAYKHACIVIFADNSALFKEIDRSIKDETALQ